MTTQSATDKSPSDLKAAAKAVVERNPSLCPSTVVMRSCLIILFPAVAKSIHSRQQQKNPTSLNQAMQTQNSTSVVASDYAGLFRPTIFGC